MFWRMVRFILILFSAAFLVSFLYLLSTTGPPPNQWLALAILSFLVLNLIYLIRSVYNRRADLRLIRSVSMWPDRGEAAQAGRTEKKATWSARLPSRCDREGTYPSRIRTRGAVNCVVPAVL